MLRQSCQHNRQRSLLPQQMGALCVCQLLSGLKVKICPEVTEPQQCQPQHKEQRTPQHSCWRRTCDQKIPTLHGTFCVLLNRTAHLKKNKLPRVISQPTYNTWENEVIFEHEEELHDLPVVLLKVKLPLYRPRWYPEGYWRLRIPAFSDNRHTRWRGQPYEPAAFTHFC